MKVSVPSDSDKLKRLLIVELLLELIAASSDPEEGYKLYKIRPQQQRWLGVKDGEVVWIRTKRDGISVTPFKNEENWLSLVRTFNSSINLFLASKLEAEALLRRTFHLATQIIQGFQGAVIEIDKSGDLVIVKNHHLLTSETVPLIEEIFVARHLLIGATAEEMPSETNTEAAKKTPGKRPNEDVRLRNIFIADLGHKGYTSDQIAKELNLCGKFNGVLAVSVLSVAPMAGGVAGGGKNATAPRRLERGFPAKVLLRFRPADRRFPDLAPVGRGTWSARGGRGTGGFLRW